MIFLWLLIGLFFAVFVFVWGFKFGREVGISATEIKYTLYPSNGMLHNDKLK